MSGFDALPHGAWVNIAAGLALPWHPDAAAHDLRWYAAEHHVHGRTLPSVRDLAQRWGWTRTRVHDVLSRGEWADPTRPWAWRRPDSIRTPSGQSADAGNGRTPATPEVPDSGRTASGHDPDSRAASKEVTRSPDHPDTQRPPPPGGSPLPPDPEAHHAPSPLPSPGGDPAPLDTPRGADADPEPGEPAPADAPVGDVRADVEAGRDIPGKPSVSPRPEAVPAWTTSAAECRPHPRQAVAEMVLRSLEAIRQRPVSPERCGTDAKPVLGLWRALGKPDPAEFAAELALVAEAARECPAPLFARSLRAEGWAEGTDRSRSVATLCRREPWGDRLEAARAWRGQPTTVAVPEPDAPPSRAMLAWRTLEAIKATGKRSGDPLEAEAIAVARELDLFAALRASPLEGLGPTRARFLANFHHAEAAK